MSQGGRLGEWSGWPDQAKDMYQISHGFCRLRRSVCVTQPWSCSLAHCDVARGVTQKAATHALCQPVRIAH